MKRTIWESSVRDASRAFYFHFSPIHPILESFFTNIKPDLHFWWSGLLWLSNMLYDRDSSSRPICAIRLLCARAAVREPS